MGEEKRKRAINFTPREQNLLFSIVLKYKKILENKETNAATNSAKNEAWSKVTSEFNASSMDFNNRTTEQLKRFYENKRMLARKKVADARQNVLKTGGGPPPPKDDEDQLVLSTMDPLTFEGLKNQFDSDSVTTIDLNMSNQIEYIFEQSKENDMLQQTRVETCNEKFLENEEEEPSEKSEENRSLDKKLSIDNIEIEEKSNWKKYNTKDLKSPMNPLLRRPESNNKSKESECQQHTITEEPQPKIAKGNSCEKGVRRRLVQDRRRPTATVIRSVASNALAQKYNELADKKNVIADHAIKKIERERLYAEREHQLKIRNLELDLQIKQKQLEKL